MSDFQFHHLRVIRIVMALAILTVAASGGGPCHAQTQTTLRKIEVVGLQRISSDQVILASGLQIGQVVDGNMMDAAADKLMRSGWFRSVSYRVRTADSDMTVIFEVEEKPSNTSAAAAATTTGDVLGQVQWTGNQALSSQELSTAFALSPGDPADRAKVDQGLEAVRKAYARKGYISARVEESSTRDAPNRRVSYQFVVREDKQYRMGALLVTGLGPADAQRLRSRWTLAPNAIFDDSYLDNFRQTVIRPFVANLAQRSGVRTRFEVTTKPDAQKQTVDVLIIFK
jgi:outer membrane protein assembly factor BamA